MILRGLLAAAVCGLALAGGSYGLSSRSSLAIAIWWTIIVAVVLGLWPLARLSRGALAAGSLLAAFALLAGASAAWAPSAERALIEADRAALYLGVFALVALASSRANFASWSDGLAAGIAAVGLLALVSRCFPDLIGNDEVSRLLPGAGTRLTFPVNYWNGLASFLALGVPLLLRPAVAAARPVWRGIALVPLPALAAAIYLTSSRGGAAATILGTAVFLALTGSRWRAAGAVLTAALGSSAAIATLAVRTELVDGPLGSDAALRQGRSAALLIVVICAGTGLAYGVASRYLRRPAFLGPAAGWAATGAVVVGVVAAIAAADPVKRFAEFRAQPSEASEIRANFAQAHLLSGSGSGRWQFWGVALEEFEQHPIIGRGAGSFESWWAQHGSFAHFIRDAHSLYLEVLGELGLLGLVLIVACFAVGAGTGVRGLLRAENDERVTLAALVASFLAYALVVGVDWMWELTIVSVMGVACLGLLASQGGTIGSGPRPTPARIEPRRWWTFARGVALLSAAWLILCAEAVPLLTQIQVRASQAAVRRGDLQGALDHAMAARSLEPWAASPYLQLALVEEERGDLPAAGRWVGEAIERDGSDWQLWLIRTRVETRAGRIAAARRSLARAAELNPRSPLFARRSGDAANS